MSGEVSYFSRFFVKFLEISAAGLASAICAYLLAHLGGLLSSSSAPPQTAVQVGSTASEVPGSRHAEPGPPAAAPPVNEQRPAPPQDADVPVAQPARKAVKDTKGLPQSKHTKTDTSRAEKEPRGQKSAEALARAALANVDANRPAPADALIEPGLANTLPAPVEVQHSRANAPPRQADLGPPQPVAVPHHAAGIEAAPYPADGQPQPATSSATGAGLQPRSPDVRSSPVAPVDIQRRPVTGADPLPPRTDPPLEVGASQQLRTVDQDNGVFSAFKRIPDLLRPDPPAPTGEAPRPPLPVGSALPQIK